MARKSRVPGWITAGTFAAALFAVASPASARDGWVNRSRIGFRPHARISVFARPYFPHARFAPFPRFGRFHHAVRVFEPYPRFVVRRAFWPRAVVVYRHGRRFGYRF